MECAYCNSEATTRDHVPPKGIFPKIKPDNLITVPCCIKCNNGFSKNDEFVQIILQLRDDVSNKNPGFELFEKVIRNLNRPEATGLNHKIFNSIRMHEIRTKSGLYIGKQNAITVKTEIIMQFINRMAYGLFYYIFKKRIPEHLSVTPVPFLETNHARLKTVLNTVKKENFQSIGNDIFRFSWVEAVDSPFTSFWYMEFYGLVPFGAIVFDPNPPNIALNSNLKSEQP